MQNENPTIESQRLQEHYNGDKKWLRFGPYLTERQWGTVREDYSYNGDAWHYVTHHMAKSKAYRWGEEGIAGISDDKQHLCFAFAFWNKKDDFLKERLFGLNGPEGNHGEDVKELYYYLDSSPTHSYMKMLYKYPQNEFPYDALYNVNKRRSRKEDEYEILDTGIFNNDEYFDIYMEYAKADENDLLIKVTVCNRANKSASINVLPTLWFRNTWMSGHANMKPRLKQEKERCRVTTYDKLPNFTFHAKEEGTNLYCDNETNYKKLYGVPNQSKFTKDGINDFIVLGKETGVNPKQQGTKMAYNIDVEIPAHESKSFCFRLEANNIANPFEDFDAIFEQRKQENDAFYNHLQKGIQNEDERNIQRQAYAGMLWTKQFYYYEVNEWLDGDPNEVSPPNERKEGRNNEWRHLNNHDIISMPDKWEYPWYAAWDLAFHCIPLAKLDAQFAKNQLILLTREWYMHPNGQLPAYEWNFGDVNPPVHAWGALEIFLWEKKHKGIEDIPFLESIFHKLLLNFTWWVNQKDTGGNNIFQGGFLGLDNIGVFDRSKELPTGGHLEQADGTSWMAMFSLNMMKIALELASHNAVYQDMATKFFEHFLYIASAMANLGGEKDGLWDEEDKFFYDLLRKESGKSIPLKIRSMVGLTPLFAVEVLDDTILKHVPEFEERLKWFLERYPKMAALVSRWEEKNKGEQRLLSLLRGHRMKKLLKRMLDETEFLSEYGVRALSKYHKDNPYIFRTNNKEFRVDYVPAESDSNLFGGNSNWRGPIWFPVNFMLIESLQKFYEYYGPDFIVEYPTNSGEYLNLQQIANKLGERLIHIFKRDDKGKRAVFGTNEKHQTDPHFKDHILFYEYFHGDNGRGVGASHQTGWTGLVAELIKPSS